MKNNLITYKNEEKRLVTAPVLIPNYDDCDACRGEKQLTPTEIEYMAHKFMENHRIVDKQHDYHQTKKEVAVPVESWILKEDTTFKNINNEEITYPTGTWMATVKITDEETWNKVKKGEYTGFSVTALPEDLANQFAGKSRTLIKDLKNPVGYTISIVERPCVFDAKFTSVKAIDESESYEHITETLTKALRTNSSFENPYIKLTFKDKIILHDYNDIEGGKYFETDYTIDSEDNVSFGEFKKVKQQYVEKQLKKRENMKYDENMIEKAVKQAKDFLNTLKNLDKQGKETKTMTKEKKEKSKKTEDEYVKKSDLEQFKMDVLKGIDEKLEKLTKKEDTDETKEKEDSSNKKEEEKESKEQAGKSKALKNHESGDKVTKSDTETVYEIMNRHFDGSAKKTKG